MRHLLFAATLLATTLTISAADVEHKFQSSIAQGQIARVTIEIPHGSIKLRNGDPNRLALSGIASRDYDGSREKEWAQKVVNDTSVEFYVNGPEAVVRRRFGPNADSWRGRKFTGLDLHIELPKGVDVVFETSAGEIDIAGEFGNVDLDLRAGEIKVRTPRASVRELKASCRVGEVRTHLGNEIVTREGVLPGRTRFFNPAGRSRMTLHVTAGEIDVALTQ